jgi:metal-sulfur cluster biosynthetic enzyme
MHPAEQAASITQAEILAALRDCYDPEVPLNIVDLGLVHSIDLALDPDAPGAGIPGVPVRHRVTIALTLTQIVDAEDTPLIAQIIAQIQNRLAAFETVSHTNVTLLREPAWNPGRITPEGRARLANPPPSNQPAHALVQIQTHPGKANA